MQFEQWLKNATLQLSAVGIESARLDAIILAEDVTQKDRAWLLANSKEIIDSTKLAKLQNLLNIRTHHTPIAYMRGKAEFYGRNFIITPSVLVPRPETETMVDMVIKLSASVKTPVISDVGTGSGALGVTVALELPRAQVELIDIDDEVLKVAKRNVDLFTLKICVVNSNLLLNSTQQSEILMCNLPYVPDDYIVNLSALHEPKLAIFGGPDGLDIYRQLFAQISIQMHKPLYILLEALPSQHSQLTLIAEEVGYRLVKTDDFIQLFKS
jgi:release factor glutamine methyltransferase